MAQELTSRALRRTWTAEGVAREMAAGIEPLTGIVGQERAVKALRFGLGIDAAGFHVYVAGPRGTGKMTAVRGFLEELARDKPAPCDWVYVNDFEDPSRPKACRLPAGRGRELQLDLRNLVDHVRRAIPGAFESDEYGAKRQGIRRELDRQRSQLVGKLNERASQTGFAIQPTPLGIAIVPVLKGRPLGEAEFQALPAATRDDLLRRREQVQDDFAAAMKQIRDLERNADEQVRELDRQVTLYIVGGMIDELTEKYRDLPELVSHLRAVREDLLEGIDLLKGSRGDGDRTEMAATAAEAAFRKYDVNLLVDNGKRRGSPVVVEASPTYATLFGRIEKETQFGTVHSDFTFISAGALHLANGGYLVLPVEDLLRSPFAWDALKRALRGRRIRIEELGERFGLFTSRTLQPEPIPLDVKVVLVGRPRFYHLLHVHDEDFPELFKVKAEFDWDMPASAGNVRSMVAFLQGLCVREKLGELDAGGAARLLEHAARIAEDRGKLSTHFGALADVVREAAYLAREDRAAQIGAPHVRRALEARAHRSNLLEERLLEMAERRTLLVETRGAAMGQVNALSVVELGDYAFGRAVRITASAGPGREGVIDIEREVQLGGPLHSKGVMILSGYIVQRYAPSAPLTLAGRLVFEQSYDEVEGDSASSAELYAMLSVLAEVPLAQGIAVTGSVNQHGEVQPVGGINEKIEGFFDLCRAQGLTGEQGVVIPQANLHNLMLREDLVEAVEGKRFRVWAVRTVDEGMELLTGMTAGERDAQGAFPAGSINQRIEQRLEAFAASLAGFGAGEDVHERHVGYAEVAR